MDSVTIEKLNNKGQGVSIQNPKLQIWNSLPDELVEYEVIKNKKGKKECKAINILSSSKHRIEVAEPDHYLSCSPLQICDFEFENNFKISSTKDKFDKFGLVLPIDTTISSSPDVLYGYRNKMEYSFYADDNNQIFLSFFMRGSHRGKIPISGCKLAHPSINIVAEKIVAWINSNQIQNRDLKSVVLRSNSKGQVIAGLFVKSELLFENYPDLDEKFVGFQIFYSNPKSPASVNDKLLFSSGQNFLEELVDEYKFHFGIFSFFQVNIEEFVKVISDIKSIIPLERELIDLYSGVGSIGISLSQNFENIKMVEVVEEANKYASDNILLNKLSNVESICSKSEEVLDIISPSQIVVVDPPREGLHKSLITRLVQIKPEYIVYLSCNPDTQAENLTQLINYYEIIFAKFYNFFPRTIHTESLIILKRK